ncbi:hypothetical protein O1611_g1571 [Lasiodiplodia mahajangana]|uniref:Uncharacterized protein n=1 Tax=Lasiodiplodia mahajangana TaxID=1108764 RepID=A0ACC2JX04_9PEZI|nr:hypothetical protein O1611_g1571 [Lasiodiplodia mahajangana]
MPLAVFLVEYLGSARNHHALFVRSNGNDGQLFHVRGDIQRGMTYETKASRAPEDSASYVGMRQIGWVSSSNLGQLDAICRSNPPPEKQFNGPKRIDPRRPLRRCQEWTAESIEMLESAGVLRPLSTGASGSRSGGARASSRPDETQYSTTSGSTRPSSNRGPANGETSSDGYWTWSTRYGDWYHVDRNGQTTWAQEQRASLRKIRIVFQHWLSHQTYNRSDVMEANSIAQASLDRLPPEVIHAILSQLSDLTALRCAILSCRFIWNSFTGSSSAIATRVFLNELDSCDVRPEAIVALLASRLAKPTRSSAHEFYKAHLQKRNVEAGICLTLNEVADLSRLHSAAFRLVEDFAKSRLQEFVATMKDGHTSQPPELSALEKQRIMRFNEMAAHDVYWGAFQVEPVRWFGDPQLQSLYFKGLVSLDGLAKAKTYDRQHALLDHGRIPHARSRNLYRALKDFSYEVCDEQVSVSNYGNSVKHPYFEDPDDGPFSIWKWAHESASLRRSVYQRGQAKLRKWGYVMWDRTRLDTLSIFRDTWRPPVLNPFARLLPDDSVGEVDERWTSSWWERSRIYNEQGRGWWDFGDESKIVWARDKDGPGRGPRKTHNTPSSLDEAKRALLALGRP